MNTYAGAGMQQSRGASAATSEMEAQQSLRLRCCMCMTIVQTPPPKEHASMDPSYYLQIRDVRPDAVPRIVRFFSSMGKIQSVHARTTRSDPGDPWSATSETKELRIEFVQLQQLQLRQPILRLFRSLGTEPIPGWNPYG